MPDTYYRGHIFVNYPISSFNSKRSSVNFPTIVSLFHFIFITNYCLMSHAFRVIALYTAIKKLLHQTPSMHPRLLCTISSHSKSPRRSISCPVSIPAEINRPKLIHFLYNISATLQSHFSHLHTSPICLVNPLNKQNLHIPDVVFFVHLS